MFLVRFIFIVISTSIFAQQTNIEQIPSPKIDNKNLKTLLLNDGTPIYAMYDTSEILPWSKNLYDSHKPALFKLKNNDIIYNYYAIQNTKLCPIGKHVITINDVKLTDNSEKSRLSFYLPSLFLDYTGNCQTSNEITVKKDKIIAVETKTTIKEIDANKFLSVIFSSDGSFTDFKNETSDFLPTRCVEDLTYSFKNNVYSYASLMPQKFDQLKQKLSQEVLFRSENNSLAGSQGIFNLGFNHSGENTSTLTANSNLEFWNSLIPLIKNKENLPPPFYETIFPATKDVFNIILYEKKDNSKLDKTKSELFEHKDFFNSSYAVNHFTNINLEYSKNQYSFYRTSKIKVEPFKYAVYIDNILQKNPSYFITKFHLNSSLTPIKSLVFPGLGSKALSFGNIHRTHKALAITSLVLSAISFTVSEVYYQSYLRNINTEPHSMNYELANSFHKVGIVSLGIYPLISISDILSCYIKCKSDGIQLAGNKRIQRLVNKEINDNRRKNIYLCRD